MWKLKKYLFITGSKIRRVKIVNSLVLELQSVAWNSEEKVTNLLRKALVVAKKLGVTEFASWIDSEMYGYKETKVIPDYRKVTGVIRAFNPYYGWQNVYFDSQKFENAASTIYVNQSVAELEDLYNSKGGRLSTKLPSSVTEKIYNQYGVGAELSLSKASILHVIEAVKSTILDWALKLEQDGILGEGMTFSLEEKEKAAQQNYTTIIYGMSNSQIQQGANSTQHLNTGINVSEVKELITVISTLINSVDLDTSGQSEVQNELQMIQNELEGGSPKPGIIKSSLFAIGRIIGGAGESIISDQLAALVTEYAKNIM